jgi:hypothetical protein
MAMHPLASVLDARQSSVLREAGQSVYVVGDREVEA